eukprot:3706253-Rhodomonas_salina.5
MHPLFPPPKKHPQSTRQDWLGNIRDWCISRQLWWGHRIPAYYILFAGEERVIPKSEDFTRWVVAKTEEEALQLAKEKHPGSTSLPSSYLAPTELLPSSYRAPT